MKRYKVTYGYDGIPIAIQPVWWDMLYAFPMFIIMKALIYFLPQHPLHSVKFKDWCLHQTPLMLICNILGWEIVFTSIMMIRLMHQWWF